MGEKQMSTNSSAILAANRPVWPSGKWFVHAENKSGDPSLFAGRRDKKLGRQPPDSETGKAIGILKKGKNARNSRTMDRRGLRAKFEEPHPLKVGDKVTYCKDVTKPCFALLKEIVKIEGEPDRYCIGVCPYGHGDTWPVEESLLQDVTCHRDHLMPAPERKWFRLR